MLFVFFTLTVFMLVLMLEVQKGVMRMLFKFFQLSELFSYLNTSAQPPDQRVRITEYALYKAFGSNVS